MGARYPWLDFQYENPEPGFDRRQVYGVAAKLFSIKDAKFSVALDTAGGGKVSSTGNYYGNLWLISIRATLRKTGIALIGQPT